MNHYTITELSLGQSEQFTVTVTAEMLDRFRDYSGDVNPLHNDENYAAERGYPGRVVFGMLVAGFYSTLAGVYLPGELCLLHEVTTKFKKPVFIGDVLTITGRISEIQEAFGRIEIDAKITNQNGITVNRGCIKAGILQKK
ncbi:MAG: MaoC family dehydratase [Oscillospiraceae bacterium]